MTDSTSSPRLSVLLTVYNAEQSLAQAVQSILTQSFSDFEFIVIDDGSTDGSLEILRRFEDPRIRLVSRENRGLAASLNEGLALARADLVARQDADDISEPDRLRRQIEYLDRHPEIGLLGTNYVAIDQEGREVGTTDVFTHPDDVKVAEALSNQFGHGSVMFHRSIVSHVGAYDPEVGYVEDYDLFARISHKTGIANLAEPLYRWRRSVSGISLSNQDLQIAQTFAIRDREFARLCARRAEYRVFTSFHPFSLRTNALRYFDRKGSLYRDVAYMYRRNAKRRKAFGALVAATLVAPWRRRNLRYLWAVLRSDETCAWGYEFL